MRLRAHRLSWGCVLLAVLAAGALPGCRGAKIREDAATAIDGSEVVGDGRPLDEFPLEGSYAIGVNGRDSHGNPTTTRGIVLAIGPTDASDPPQLALADALAVLGDHLLMSLSALPHSIPLSEAVRYAPDRDPQSHRLTLTNDQGRAVARALGADAILSVRVPASGALKLALTDLATDGDSYSDHVEFSSAEAALEQFPSAVARALAAAQVACTDRDAQLLSRLPFPAGEYLSVGRIVSCAPSRESVRLAEAFIGESRSSVLARQTYHLIVDGDRASREASTQAAQWAVDAGDACPAIHLAAAGVHARSGADDLLSAAVDRYRETSPHSIQADLLQARRAQARGERRPAVELLRHALESNPRDAAAWSLLASVHWDRVSHAQGGRHVGLQALSAQGTLPAALRSALLCAEKAVALAPASPEALTLLITLQRENGRPSAAGEALAQCDKVRPGFAAAYAEMLWTHAQGYGDDSDAYGALLDQAAAARPRYAWGEVRLAGLLLQQGRSADALAHYRLAGELAPDYFPRGWAEIGADITGARFSGGEANQHEAGALRLAETCLRRSLAQRPTVSAETSLGRLLLRTGRYAEAETVLLDATGVAPEDPSALISLGAAQRCLEKWPRAEASFRAAWEAGAARHPDQTWGAIFQAMARDGRAREARREIKRLRKRNPRLAATLGDFGIGSCYLAISDLDAAEERFREIPRRDWHHGVYDNIALCMAARGEWREAHDLFLECIESVGEACHEPYIGLAVCKYMLGQESEALELRDRVMEMNRGMVTRAGLWEQLWPVEAVDAFEQLSQAPRSTSAAELTPRAPPESPLPADG